MSYDVLFEYMKEKGCQLLTSEEDYCMKKQGRKVVKVDYIASCGHQHQVYSNVFKSRGTGIKCPRCVIKENTLRVRQLPTKDNGQAILIKMEDDAIIYLGELIKDAFRLRKTWEGCLYDLAIQPIECDEDKWLPIQVKTNSKPLLDYGFNCSHRYKDSLIFCLCLSDKKMWIIPGNEIKSKCKIAIGLKKSKYDVNIVIKENIVDVFSRYYSSMMLFYFEDLDIPVSPQQQKEREYRKYMESKCQFLKFEYPERNCLVYDFMVNGHKVQEKVASVRKNRDKTIVFTIHKNNGSVERCRKFQSYCLGDNDFYWLQFPDKKYFYVLPESVLLCDGFINDGNSESYKKIMCFSIKDMSKVKYQEYLFEYDALDAERLKGMFGLV